MRSGKTIERVGRTCASYFYFCLFQSNSHKKEKKEECVFFGAVSVEQILLLLP
jgi:hypothetical protein